MAEQLVTAYDTRTGKKLDRRVPAVWLRIFPHLSSTPQQKAADNAAASDDVPEADSPEDVDPTPMTAPRRRTTKKES